MEEEFTNVSSVLSVGCDEGVSVNVPIYQFPSTNSEKRKNFNKEEGEDDIYSKNLYYQWKQKVSEVIPFQ